MDGPLAVVALGSTKGADVPQWASDMFEKEV
jgi:hypothetical protein